MSFLEKIQSSRKALIYLSLGKDQGRAAWHYVAVDKQKLPLFLKDHKTVGNTTDLNSYGKVLYSGWGENPPEEIKQKIQDEFGQ